MTHLLVVLGVCCGQVSIGHRAGIALTNWAFSGGGSGVVDEWNNNMSRIAGSYFEIPVEVSLSKRIVLQSGAGFIQKGFGLSDGKEQYRTGYLQLPLSLGMRLEKGHFRITPALGCAFAANMRGSLRYQYSEDLDPIRLPIGRLGDLGFNYQMPMYEMSLLAQGSVTYSFERSRIGLEVGYLHGMSNMMIQYVDELTDLYYPEGSNDRAIPEKALQRTLMFSVGYSLDLGKREPVAKDSASVAEAKKPARITIGQRFGASYTTIMFQASLPEEQERVVDGAEPWSGLATAVVVNIRLSDHFSLQPEVAYTQRGWRAQWYPRPTDRNDRLRMNYLELPLLVRYAHGHGELRPFAFAGVVFARGVGGYDILYRGQLSNGAEFAYPSPMSFGDEPGNGQYVMYDWAYALGVGASWKRGRSEIFLDLRYQPSITDFVEDWNSLLYSNEVTAKHRVWLLNLGYLIPW